MNNKRINTEQALYLLVFLLALTLRFVRLGQAPLADSEAGLALQARDLIMGNAPALGPTPGYILFTSILFYLFQAANWTARFWPALAGSLLVLAPFLLRNRLGRGAALLLALLLAFDPGLLAVSRQVNSLPLAMLGLTFALAFWSMHRPGWAGASAALALLGGPTFWPGLLGLGLALVVSYPLWLKTDELPEADLNAQIRTMLISGLITLAAAGTLLWMAPRGLSLIGSSLAAYLNGWRTGSDVSVGLSAAGLAAYELFGLVMGLAGLIVGLRRGEGIDRFLALWWLLSLLLALVYPARQVFDLAWTVLPMLALAARLLVILLDFKTEERLPSIGFTLLTALLLLFISNSIVKFTQPVMSNSFEATLRWAVLVTAVVLVLLTTGLVMWGWSPKIGLNGLGLGTAGVLLLFSIAAGFSASGLSRNPAAEIWRQSPAFTDADLLKTTLDNFSQWRKAQGITQIAVLNIQSPALRWLLRDYPNVTYADVMMTGSRPDLVITPDQPELQMAASYRGQGFIYSHQPSWGIILPSEWLNWIVFRKVQTETQEYILWVRTDLFAGEAPQAGAADSGTSIQSK